jgi:hypothetical protein
MTNQPDPMLEEAAAVADAMTALVGVTNEGLRDLVEVFGGVERIQGRPGDPGPPGPPGIGVKGDPGPRGDDGAPAPSPVRVVAERDFQQRLTGAKQVFADGSTVHFDARRDASGRIAEFVKVSA